MRHGRDNDSVVGKDSFILGLHKWLLDTGGGFRVAGHTP